MNQTILGFQSAFISEKVFASINMEHEGFLLLLWLQLVHNLILASDVM